MLLSSSLPRPRPTPTLNPPPPPPPLTPTPHPYPHPTTSTPTPTPNTTPSTPIPHHTHTHTHKHNTTTTLLWILHSWIKESNTSYWYYCNKISPKTRCYKRYEHFFKISFDTTCPFSSSNVQLLVRVICYVFINKITINTNVRFILHITNTIMSLHPDIQKYGETW